MINTKQTPPLICFLKVQSLVCRVSSWLYCHNTQNNCELYFRRPISNSIPCGVPPRTLPQQIDNVSTENRCRMCGFGVAHVCDAESMVWREPTGPSMRNFRAKKWDTIWQRPDNVQRINSNVGDKACEEIDRNECPGPR